VVFGGGPDADLVDAVVDDAVYAGGVQDVVADAGIAAGLAGDDAGEGRVIGRVEGQVGEVDADDGGAVARGRDPASGRRRSR
jgi:hypothetical protein